MAIVFPLTWPDLAVEEITMTPVNTVAESASQFTGQSQVFEWPRQYWQADLKLPQMSRENAEKWICFLIKLRGKAGTFLMPPVVGNIQRGAMAGSPLVDGGSQSGLELNIRNMTAGAVNVFREGDYFQLGVGSSARLYKVLNDVSANASGKATLDIWPRLRTAPNDGDSVIYNNPVGLFRLLKNENPFRYVSPQRASISFSVKEAL